MSFHQFDTPDGPLWQAEAALADGGFNTSQELHLLKPNEVARLLNIDPTFTGRVQKRQGIGKYGSAGQGNPNSLSEFYVPFQNIQLLLGQWGNKLYSSPGNGIWTPQATGISLADTYYNGAMGRGPGGLATLFLASCVGMTSNVSVPFGNLVCLGSNFSYTETGLKAKAIAWFQNRLWHFNSASSGPNFVGWSKPLDGSDNSNGETFEVDPDNGDAGVAIIPMRDSTPRLLLFKERSIHMAEIVWASDGYYPTTANALDFTHSLLRPITLQTGLVATRAAVWASNAGAANADLLFLSREGVRSLQRSQNDDQQGAGLPISQRIQDTIDRINWVHADKACATYWNNKAYFAVPVDGADRNNLVLAYDTVKDAWYELDYQVAAWAPCKLANERSLFFMSATGGTETGIIGSSGATNGFHVYRTEASQVDPFGAPVQFDFQTRSFDFASQGGGLGVDKKWNWLDLSIQAAATCATLSVQYKLNDDDTWSDLATVFVDPSDGYPVLPIQLPFGFSAGKVIDRSLYLGDIAAGGKLQFRVLDTLSYARLKIVSMRLNANPANPGFKAVR